MALNLALSRFFDEKGGYRITLGKLWNSAESLMVPTAGLEPARDYSLQILSLNGANVTY